MAQKRTHDYRGPRSSENLNGHLVGAVPYGIYEGFHVWPNGEISQGMLITPEGIRIEETAPISVVVPASDPANPRYDLVVCIHEYQKTVPAPPATFVVVQGVAAADPAWPDLPAHAVLVACCRMEAGAGVWTDIQQLGYPARVYNAVHHLDHSWTIVLGDRAAMMEVFDPNTGVWATWIVAPGTYGDDDTITWGAPAFECGANGILQVLTHIADPHDAHDASAISVEDTEGRYTADEVEAALAEIAGAGRTTESVKGNAANLLTHVNNAVGAHAASAISIADAGGRYTAEEAEAALQEIAGSGRTSETVKDNADDIANLDTDKLDKAGGTITGDLVIEGAVTGDLVLQAKVTFDADDVADVAFDDWIDFTHWVQPCEGNSADWDNLGSHWKSPAPGGSYKYLYLPIPGIVNAELVSVDVGFNNADTANTNMTLVFQRGNILGAIVAPTELGSGGGLLEASDSAVFNFPGVQVVAPYGDLPIPFDTTSFLQLKVRTLGQLVSFSGMKVNYRRKRIAV